MKESLDFFIPGILFTMAHHKNTVMHKEQTDLIVDFGGIASKFSIKVNSPVHSQ